MGAQQRREEVLAAALQEFSHKGLHGGSTMTIARAADLSHPNLFRLFSTKKELFMEVLVRAFEMIEREMLPRGATGTDPTKAMADAWCELMAHRELMLVLLQGYAASDDPDIRDLMQRATQGIFERVEAMPGVGTDKAHTFVAEGTLYMIAAAMDLPARAAGDPWADRFLTSG
ncbi:TetR family transcriptional regulator [Sphaerisporangium siamense]|nr:TetR family transcriptional regulator [Sphaerisporangium siamense]